jgi:hypothetical protein
MDGHGDGLSGKGLCRLKLLFDGPQGRHKILHPGNFHPSMLCQGHISYNTQANLPFYGDFGLTISQNPHKNKKVYTFFMDISL